MGKVHRVADDAQARARRVRVARGTRRPPRAGVGRPVAAAGGPGRRAARQRAVVVEPCWLPRGRPRAHRAPQGARRRRRRDHRRARRAGRHGQHRRRQRSRARAHRVAAAADAHCRDWRRPVVADAGALPRRQSGASPTSAATSSRSPARRARATSRARWSSASTARATFTSSSSADTLPRDAAPCPGRRPTIRSAALLSRRCWRRCRSSCCSAGLRLLRGRRTWRRWPVWRRRWSSRSGPSACRRRWRSPAPGYGAAYGLLPIGWIVLNVIFLYQLTNERGLVRRAAPEHHARSPTTAACSCCSSRSASARSSRARRGSARRSR